MYALTTICYNRGNIKLTINGRTTTFLEVYNRASSLYSVNSWEHNRYIWDNWWSYSTSGDRSRSRDASFETYVKGYYDLAQSRGGGVFARTCYVYWTQEQLNRLDSPKTYQLQELQKMNKKYSHTMKILEKELVVLHLKDKR